MNRRALALSGAALLLVGCTAAELPGDRSFVQAQWVKGVERLGLGLRAVYPPSEDYQVGDVYAVGEPCDADKLKENPIPTTLKVGLANVGARLANSYSRRLLFPDFPSQAGDSPKTLPPAVAVPLQPASADNHPRQMTPVPMVAFPAFTVAAGKLSEFAGTGAFNLFGALFGTASRSDVSLSINVNEGETYGLNATDAANALGEYCASHDCAEGRLVEQLRATFGDNFCHARVSMISRVYMTRNLVYSYAFADAQALAATVLITQQDAVTKQQALSTILAKAPVATSTAGDAKTKSDATNQALTALGVRDEVMASLVSGLQDDLTKLGQTGAPGGSLTLASTSAQQISLSQTFVRPLVFGYNSITCQPGATTCMLSYPSPSPGPLGPATPAPGPLAPPPPPPPIPPAN